MEKGEKEDRRILVMRYKEPPLCPPLAYISPQGEKKLRSKLSLESLS